MADPNAIQRGILVFYERGDTEKLYNDATLRQAVASLNYSIVWAHECDARSTGGFQADASAGPGRMLQAALDQFALKSGHRELANAGIILYGFSAAGVLTATMANAQPARLVGNIQYAAGSAYTDLDDVPISDAAAHVSTLILANARDTQSGTERSLRFFERGRSLGAPWAYAVQNQTSHCCNLSTKNIILPWIQDIAHVASASLAGNAALVPTSATANFICTPDGVRDAQDETDCSFTTATFGTPSSREDVGWVPSQAAGAAWLAWVTSPQTN
jgi:dienelactone hydrolase